MHIAATSPLAINENDIDSEIIEKEKLIDEELKNSGKSIDIIEKISLGKIKNISKIIV